MLLPAITCAYHLRDVVILWATGIPWNFKADAIKSERVTGLIRFQEDKNIFSSSQIYCPSMFAEIWPHTIFLSALDPPLRLFWNHQYHVAR